MCKTSSAEMIKDQETVSSFFFTHFSLLIWLKWNFKFTLLMQRYMGNLKREWLWNCTEFIKRISTSRYLCWAWRRIVGDKTDGNTSNRLAVTILLAVLSYVVRHFISHPELPRQTRDVFQLKWTENSQMKKIKNYEKEIKKKRIIERTLRYLKKLTMYHHYDLQATWTS